MVLDLILLQLVQFPLNSVRQVRLTYRNSLASHTLSVWSTLHIGVVQAPGSIRLYSWDFYVHVGVINIIILLGSLFCQPKPPLCHNGCDSREFATVDSVLFCR